MRMLCSRSASLMSTTRMSSAIARNIFRMFSACCCSWLWVENRDSLVTPSTRCAISGPKASSTSARLYSVSSGTSWSSAAATATGSMPSSARIWADAIGCVTYGSPDARTWVACASTARSNARSTTARSACGWCCLRAARRRARSSARSADACGRRAAATAAGAGGSAVPGVASVAVAARDRRPARGAAGASRGTSGSRTTGSAMRGVYRAATRRPERGEAPRLAPRRA